MLLSSKAKKIRIEREKGRQLHTEMSMSVRKVVVSVQGFCQSHPIGAMALMACGVLMRKKLLSTALSSKALSKIKRLSSLL